MEAEYELLAKQTKQKVEEVQKRIMSNPDSIGQTTIKLLGQKTMNYIYEEATLKQKMMITKAQLLISIKQ